MSFCVLNISMIESHKLFFRSDLSSNGCSFGCPIVYTDIFNNAILFMDISNHALYKPYHCLIKMTFLEIISSNVTVDEAVLSPESSPCNNIVGTELDGYIITYVSDYVVGNRAATRSVTEMNIRNLNEHSTW